MQFCSLESVFDYRKVNQSVFSNGLLGGENHCKRSKTSRSEIPCNLFKTVCFMEKLHSVRMTRVRQETNASKCIKTNSN